MPVVDAEPLFRLAGLIIAFFFAFRLFRGVVRPLVTVAWRLLLGGIALWVINLAGDPAGFHIGLNPITASVAGFLGLPGLAALVGLRFFFP